MQVAFFVVPRNDFGTRTLFNVIADPLGNLIIGGTGGNERPKVVIINLSNLQPALIDGTVRVVFAFPTHKNGAAFVHSPRRQYIPRQRCARAARELFPTRKSRANNFTFSRFLSIRFSLFAVFYLLALT